MMILTKEEIDKIAEKRDFIITSPIKTMEKNTKYLALFSNYYSKLFALLGNDIDKHLEYINRVIKISIPKAKYLHYIKSNFPELYDKYILSIEEKEKRELVDQIEIDSESIYTKGVALYGGNNSTKKEFDETEELLKILELKKETIKDLKWKKIIRLGNTSSLTAVLCFIIYLI